MPEGDTLRRVAAALGSVLVGRSIVEAWLRPEDRFAPRTRRNRSLLRDESVERPVVDVRAVGKHLLIDLGTQVVRVHLGLDGDVHRYAPGERWRRGRFRAWLVLETASDVVVVFDAAAVERIAADRLETHPALTRLGPDLLAEEVAWGEVLRRARAAEAEDVGTLLLDQRVAAGIGNIWRNEALFLEGVHPRTPCAALDDDALLGLYRRARARMRRSVEGGARHHVYGKGGRPCPRCGTVIRTAVHGRDARPISWCPTCQPEPDRSD